jgi:4-amino-4-deoxy-L-arabinose transferase-like glycosyltransferase
MKRIRSYLADNRPYILLIIAALAILTWLMVYRLGSLVSGLSTNEHISATAAVGWHGIYHNALYLPLKAVRSIDFYIAADHGSFLTRLPNALFGAFSVISFTWLVWLWHGRRTAFITGLLFATSAWTVHVSRLATFDTLYLWAVPTMLLMGIALQRKSDKFWAVYGNILLWGLLLYIPGMIWLVLINAYFQRKYIAKGWRQFSLWWQRMLYVLAGLIWVPLLILNLRHIDLLKTWIGLPAHLADVSQLLQQFGAVFWHLFVRGPRQPELWLGRAPILDIFTLAMCLIGIYFYLQHPKAVRSRLLGSIFLASVILIALGGAVSLSLLVPLLYILAATGITYLLQEWLKVFPLNPLARSIGLTLVGTAVALACVYNLRAYFVAWPHNHITRTVFRVRQ